MKKVSVINYKGGVGKTSVTANLAGQLALKGYKVLMVDLDPQASLTFSFVTPEYWEENLQNTTSIKNWFQEDENPGVKFEDLIITPETVGEVLNSSEGQLDLVASHLGLINVDLELATKLGGANMRQIKLNHLKFHRRLLQGIKQLDEDTYDIILFDCPPNFNIVTKNAIVASDFILIPAKPDYLSTLGIDYLHRSVREMVSEYNQWKEEDKSSESIDPTIAGVVFTMVQFRSGEPIAALRPLINQTKLWIYQSLIVILERIRRYMLKPLNMVYP